jgi:hypothetical protein
MSNLVPLHVDKETGRIVASDKAAGQVPIGGAFGYVHHQTVGAQTWTIPHNGNTNHVICQIYDSNYDLILSDNLHVIDINNIEVAFNAPQDGFAHIIMFKTLP